MRLPCAIFGLFLVLAAPASGRLIAYTSTSCEQGGGEPRPQASGPFGPAGCPEAIWVAQEDGSAPRRLTRPAEGPYWETGDTNLTWTPDGSSIVFQRRFPGGQVVRLWAVDRDGSDLRALTTGDEQGTDNQPVFSPDGSRIAFTRVSQGGVGWAARTVRLDGTDATIAASGSGVGDALGFSPDGGRVLLSETDPLAQPVATSQVFTAAIDGSDRQPAFQGTVAPTAISSDGRWFGWLLPSMTVAVADLSDATTAVVTPQGFILGNFSPRDPSVLRVSAVDGWTLHHYEVDLDAPGRPHRPVTEEAVPGAIPEPGPVPPDPGLAATVAFGLVDPYAPDPENDYDDPWDEPSRATLRSANASARRDPTLGYSALAYAGLRSVSYSVGRRAGRGRCSYFTGRRFLIHGRCGARHWRRISSPEAWADAADRLPHGTYEVAFRAIDRRGRRSSGRVRVVRL